MHILLVKSHFLVLKKVSLVLMAKRAGDSGFDITSYRVAKLTETYICWHTSNHSVGTKIGGYLFCARRFVPHGDFH